MASSRGRIFPHKTARTVAKKLRGVQGKSAFFGRRAGPFLRINRYDGQTRGQSRAGGLNTIILSCGLSSLGFAKP
jgi:hypothetical protein